jgi:hypothetical protein
MQQIPLQHIMQQITLKIYAARGGHYRLCKQRASSVGVAQQAKCGLHSAANNIQQIAATLQLHKEPHNAVPRSCRSARMVCIVQFKSRLLLQ